MQRTIAAFDNNKPLEAISKGKIQFTRQIYSIELGVNSGKWRERGEKERIYKTAQLYACCSKLS